MGIKGIYQEIGPGERVALSKLALETYEKTHRPLRLAIDISIWLFQIQSSKGGTNPALRTFYYRLLRLISLSIHPLFVFDGPNKPPFKRNKRTGPNFASVPEYLAKQLLKQFGIPLHVAPGEAEAECALLQRRGVVDAVLSEDVDTLMFGSRLTFRNWSHEGKGKVPTHVNAYDAQKTKDGQSGLDREGMILVALMSGGDYIPEGIPGCGPKMACQAARAGFGKELCDLSKRNVDGIAEWKRRLCHELQTNESKFFRTKHKGLDIPEEFPSMEILQYYTHPCISSDDKIETLRKSLQWDQDIDIDALRTFTGDAFGWTCLGGAKKFIRNLAPALLIKSLRMRALVDSSGSLEEMQKQEERLIKRIHSKRNHHSTDLLTEMRISYLPHELVPIDLDAEEPDLDQPAAHLDSDDDEDQAVQVEIPEGEESASPKKSRGPSTYDPTSLERLWILEAFVKCGVPLKMEAWNATFQASNVKETAKASRKKPMAGKKSASGGMPQGALDRFTKVTKPGPMNIPSSAPSAEIRENGSESSMAKRNRSTIVDQVASPGRASPPKKRQFQRSHSDTAALGRNSQAGRQKDLFQTRLIQEKQSNTLETITDGLEKTMNETDSFGLPPRPLSSTAAGSASGVHGELPFRKTFRPPPTLKSQELPESLQKEPRTPQKKKSTPSDAKLKTPTPGRRKEDAIIISSSPSTPSSTQKQITDFLPRQQAEPASPTRAQTTFVAPKPDITKDRVSTKAFRMPLNVLSTSTSNVTASASVIRPQNNIDGSGDLTDQVEASSQRTDNLDQGRLRRVEIMDLTGV